MSLKANPAPTLGYNQAWARINSAQFFALKFRLFNREHDLPHGQHLSVSSVALQPFSSSTG
jgi:hypothetical protein